MRYTIATFALIAMFGTLIAAAPIARAVSSLEIVTVSSSGNPVPDVAFEIYTSSGELNFKQVTDSSGLFTYAIDKAGDYTIVLHWKKGQTTKEQFFVGPGLTRVVFKEPAPVPVAVTTQTSVGVANTGLTEIERVNLCRYAKGLIVGSRSEAVLTLQKLLNKAGILAVVPTGYYGEQTVIAVKKALATLCADSKGAATISEDVSPQNGDLPVTTSGVTSTTIVAPNENTKEAAKLLQELIVQMRQLLGQMEKALSLLRSN